ncbi:MAG: Re/Si-specific NAD(P)(+) transhydrogenase subunit alpha [Chitinophagales bacterium]
MIVGILKENQEENRVSALPEIAANLIKLQAEVWVESQAGHRAFASDEDYKKINAQIKSRAEILSSADLLLTIHALQPNELAQLKTNAVLLGVYQPLFNYAVMKDWAAKGLSTFSLDMIPRTTRAQSMDVLSSQASVAGYKAVILSASHYPRYFPMLTTSAGSIPPAKVLILGAGVAGLQAIATAKRLGAVVEVFDTRPAAKEEVMSLGAKFIEVDGAADASKAGGYAVEQSEEYKAKQKQRISDAIAKADIVISTAQIPGKKAPVLITKEMVERMKAGALIVDLAASTGGNCELTQNNTTVNHNSVSIVGNSNLASSVPADASKMYGKNILNFLKLIIDDKGGLNLNFEDDLVKGTCITYNGQIVNDRVKQLAEG